MYTHEELVARKKARIHETHRLNPERTALLIIDMQRSFMDNQASLCVPQAWDILPTVQKMADFCRSVNIPVVYTVFVSRPEIPCLRGDPFGPEHLMPEPGQPTGWGIPSGNSNIGMTGPEAPTIIDELRPQPGDLVIEGYTLDKFYGTPLDLALRSRDIRYLIFTGMMADLCLGTTLFSAAMREYRVTAVRDAITTIWPPILDAMFDIFERKIARMLTADDTISEIKEQFTS
jgi:nicotinamidase-related amidase